MPHEMPSSTLCLNHQQIALHSCWILLPPLQCRAPAACEETNTIKKPGSSQLAKPALPTCCGQLFEDLGCRFKVDAGVSDTHTIPEILDTRFSWLEALIALMNIGLDHDAYQGGISCNTHFKRR